MIAVMAMSALSMSAQDSKFAVGINADFAALGKGFYNSATGYTTAGLGIKLQYNFTEALRAELGYTYYFNKKLDRAWLGDEPKDGIWTINLNFAYLFKVTDKIKIGPMAGLAMVSQHMNDAAKGVYAADAALINAAFGTNLDNVKNTMALGFQIGAASEFQVSDHFKIGVDAYYKHAKKDYKFTDGNNFKTGMDFNGFVLSATAAYCF